MGGPDQPDYLNAVAVGMTRLSPTTVLARLHDIEADAGRVRDVRWGPRTLDLDLLQYGDPTAGTDVVSDLPRLTLPHPRAHTRAFVLVPWFDADQDATLRVDGVPRRVEDLLTRIDTGGVRPADDGGSGATCGSGGCAGC